MVAQHLAVVGSEQHQGVAQHPAGVLEEAAELVVDEVDHPVVGGPGAAHLVLVEMDARGVGAQPSPGPAQVVGPVAHVGGRQVAVDVAVVVEPGRRQGRMGIDEGEVEEEGAARVAALEELHGPVDDPEGVHLLLGQVMGAAHPAVGRHTVGHARVDLAASVEVAQPLHVLVVPAARGVGQLHVVEAVAPAVRVQVQLADHLGLVAGPRQLPGQGGRRVPLDPAAEADGAVGRRRRARHEAAARRDAARALGVGVQEVGAGAGQGVEVRRLQRRRGDGVGGHAVAALLVGHHEEDVGALVHGWRHPCEGGAERCTG